MTRGARISLAVLFVSSMMFAFAACTTREPAERLRERWYAGRPLYEVYLRAFSGAGTIEAVTQRLDSLEALGVRTLWLMPIHPVGVKGRKGTAGSPYSVRDYFAVDSAYGSLAGLRRLVDQAHARGIGVILDMVMNHSANDHPLMGEHPDWWMRDARGRFTREVADWSDITDWNYENERARDYLESVLLYWIREADVDGYRCDVAGLVPPDFWRRAIASVRELKPDAFLLAEWEDPWVLDAGFDAAYDWTLHHRMRAHAAGKVSLDSLWSAVQDKQRQYPSDALPLRFIENHDEPRAADVFGWPGLKPYAALVFTVPGIPLLYTGQEIGASEKPSLFEAEPVDWDQGRDEVYDFYRRLAHDRNAHQVLQLGSIARLLADKPDVLLFQRVYGEQRALVAINFSGRRVEIERPVAAGPGPYRRTADGQRLGERIALPPYGHSVYVTG